MVQIPPNADIDSVIQPSATTYPNQLQNMLTEPLKARFLSGFVSALCLLSRNLFRGSFMPLVLFSHRRSSLKKQAPQAGFPRRRRVLAQTKHF